MPMTGNKSYSLYFHIPFCTKKCDYCHFYVLPDQEPLKDDLLEGFRIEWDQIKHNFKGLSLKSIYFGGGTPSLFGPERIEEVLSWLPKAEEITIEMNPENGTSELLKAYRNLGINRLSIGLQSLSDSELVTLGRTHSKDQSLLVVETANKAGFDNISVDLMYDLPDQTLKTWEMTLNQTLKLPITHLSLYNLTIEPHTVFYKYRDKIQKQLPDEEESLQFYRMAQEKLLDAGLYQYEISAFAKPGFHSVHNSGYWTGRPFWGLGPSAYSFWNKSRFRNVASLAKYMKALRLNETPIDFRETLNPEALKREAFILKLRLLEGTERPDFDVNINPKWVEEREGKLKLTQEGILFYDSIASELVSID